jgi:hypothetical protein
VTLLDELSPTARRLYGNAHPHTKGIQDSLEVVQATLAELDA